MIKSGLVAGILILGTGVSAQADERVQYDYLGLPIEAAPVATAVVPSDNAARDYLDLPVTAARASEFSSVEPTRSVNNDYLGLPVEQPSAEVKTVQREAEFSYLY